MSQLTTHILDTSKGRPAAGIAVTLYSLKDTDVVHFASAATDQEGRVTDLLPPGEILEPGIYKMVFDTGKYFSDQHLPVFYPFVEIHFTISDASHYHIPLLLSAFGYTTYRGS